MTERKRTSHHNEPAARGRNRRSPERGEPMSDRDVVVRATPDDLQHLENVLEDSGTDRTTRGWLL